MLQADSEYGSGSYVGAAPSASATFKFQPYVKICKSHGSFVLSELVVVCATAPDVIAGRLLVGLRFGGRRDLP